ncbi:hypothetical protein ONS95_007662 [Cadophora gregata]|uniref:uncharacterized protein n=1 Tax=Cadophora gregata TaxID=51156 RepID=UPI0026DB535F|nr:uncharacterized protein ONS95_007662 [Cadophora gregata]KAK0118780.1 hypothetical protein ONS96_011865 [Cadophora gregata f. sp. sojae]KAK0126041.1 hypothetical protein ONS95_007662 [Cadophora gregata]
MPPPQSLLASKLRGFVCRSCLSKLQGYHRRRMQWASRSLTTDTVHSGTKEATHPASTSFGETQDELESEFNEGSIIEALSQEVRLRRKDAVEHSVPKSTVRFFEETPDGSREEIQDGLDEENTLDALEKEIEGLKTDTGGLMEKLVGGDPSQPGRSPLADELRAQIMEMERLDLKNLSEADRLRLRSIILKGSEPATSSTTQESPSLQPATEAYEKNPQADLHTESADDVLIPINEFPVAQQARVWQLAEALKRPAPVGRKRRGKRSILDANTATDKSHLLRVWKAYSLCRNALIGSKNKVPRDIWLRLWNIFQVEGTHNRDRWTRLKTLGDDIQRAGVRLAPSQYLLHIEATFIEGDQNDGIDMWEEYSSDLRGSEYWELGARMLAQNAQPDRALEAAESCLECSDASNSYRLLLPIIRANLGLNTTSSIKRAWALYIRLRVSYSQYLNMEDYDVLISSFLAASQPDLALGVFRDMMLTGQPSSPVEDSTSQYREVTGTTDDLTSLQITIHELDWPSPRALSKLPAHLNNKFFFGKWLKKLIGDGNLEAAKKVLDLMDERRVQPSAIQVNGLIGAWFREGSEKCRALAEDMAWRMIKTRNDFVQSRSTLNPALRFVKTPDLPSSRMIKLTPPATIETFCILISQYRRRQKAHRLTELFEAFQKSGIPPNTHFMNELLLTNKRAHEKKSALETYQTATEEQGVTPDFDTYKVLWALLKKDVDPLRGPNRPEESDRHRGCRKLFADMISKLQKSTKEAFPQDLYRLVIQTFSFAQDLTGTAVALRALQHHFGAYPDPESARIIVLQLARLGLSEELGVEPARLNTGLSITRERIASVTSILQQFKDQRVEVLQQQGIKFSELKGDDLKEEPLILLSDLLRFADRQVAQDGSKGSAERSLIAAKSMNVPGCSVWESHTKNT